MSETEILKAVIEDLKDDNKILKQTLLQAQKDYSESGMLLRDHFAGLAMQGICASAPNVEWTDALISKEAYRMADAMLADRGKDV